MKTPKDRTKDAPPGDGAGGGAPHAQVASEAAPDAEAELRRIERILSGGTGPPAGAGYPPAYGDLVRYNRSRLILDAVGEKLLAEIVQDYLVLLETSAAVYERTGDYALGIFSSGWCRFMDQASRRLCRTEDNVEALASGQWLCHESCWTQASRTAMQETRPVDIACEGGIRIYALPILAGERVVGAINFGYGDPPTEPAVMGRLADRFGVDADRLAALAAAYPSRPPFVIEMAKRRLAVSALLVGKIVEHKQTQMALRESEAKMVSIFRAAPTGIGLVSARRLLEVNERLCEMTGYAKDELIGRNARLLYPSDGDYEYVGAEKYRQIKSRGTGTVETRFRRKDGAVIDVLMSSTPIDPSDWSRGVTFTALDITGRKRAETALREAHQRFLTVLNSLDATIYVADMDTYEVLFMNRNMVESFGRDLTGERCWEAFRNETGPCAHCTNPRLLDAGGRPAGVQVWQGRNPLTGRTYVNYDRAIAWTDGRLVRIQIATDVTELQNMEAQLRQAQKMEAVGRLAGGVAHDFNNMLSIILGNTEMMLDDLGPDHPLVDNMHEIRKAAERSAECTRQLLAFARKQTIAPRVLDLNATLEGMLRMLRRLIGEDVDLVWRPQAGLWRVKVDPSQIDQILANLCVNARDAIDGVGRVVIETANVDCREPEGAVREGFRPGPHVMIAVTDSGCGMDEEALASLFEPFFTTKEVGRGTGLGLATVHGIVRQNQGFVSVDSAVGRGTTFKVYLPRHQAEAPQDSATAEPPVGPLGHGTVLLVEDEEAILRMARVMLERLGCRVLTAAGPDEAIRVARQHQGGIRLLLTDVVMPGMSGRDLAVEIARMHPDVKCLFMSGYTADVIAHHGVLEEGVAFIGKPFDRQELAAKLSDLLA